MDKKIWEILNRSLETFSQNIIDKYIEANVKIRSRSGVKAFIIRRELGRCCDWCRSLAGIYEYGDEPRDVYMRHDNCRCLVTFKNEKGYTDVWSKIEYKSQSDARVARMMDINLELGSNRDLDRATRITKQDLMKGYIPGKGKKTKDIGYKDSKNINEIKYGEWLVDNIGGDIRFINRSQHRRKADYYWHGAFWEHKTFSSHNSLDKQVQSALGQVSNRGGIVLQRNKSSLSKAEIYRDIRNRFQRSAADYGINQLYALVFNGDELEIAIKLTNQ